MPWGLAQVSRQRRKGGNTTGGGAAQNDPRGVAGALATPRSVADGSATRRARGGRIDGGSDPPMAERVAPVGERALLTPKPCLAGPRFQAFTRGRLLRPSRAVPVVLAGCVVWIDTISNYHSHRYARFDAQRPYGRSARAHEGHRETRGALKGVRGASY